MAPLPLAHHGWLNPCHAYFHACFLLRPRQRGGVLHKTVAAVVPRKNQFKRDDLWLFGYLGTLASYVHIERLV